MWSWVGIKDLEKSLQPIYLTRTYKKTSHTTWTLNIKITVICLYNLYNKFKVHVVWLVFYKFGLNISSGEIFSFRFFNIICRPSFGGFVSGPRAELYASPPVHSLPPLPPQFQQHGSRPAAAGPYYQFNQNVLPYPQEKKQDENKTYFLSDFLLLSTSNMI